MQVQDSENKVLIPGHKQRVNDESASEMTQNTQLHSPISQSFIENIEKEPSTISIEDRIEKVYQQTGGFGLF